jgi:adenylyl-sulfate kinase
VIWLTGLSGSGKSTLANGLAAELRIQGFPVQILDGDVLRATVSRDLGYSMADRRESVRRAGVLAKQVADTGGIAVAALISPIREDRERLRLWIGAGRFFEVYVHADIRICEQRDPKGLYAKARKGLIQEFTGISSPYEPPISPDLEVRTDQNPPEDCVRQVLEFFRIADVKRRAPESKAGLVPSAAAGSVA